MDKNVIIKIPKIAYGINKKNNTIEELEFYAVTESITEFYFHRIRFNEETELKGCFCYAKEIGKNIFLGENAKQNAEKELAKRLKKLNKNK